jgi:hypothetical protein
MGAMMRWSMHDRKTTRIEPHRRLTCARERPSRNGWTILRVHSARWLGLIMMVVGAILQAASS